MAYKPSMRRHMKVEPIPLDIRPVMNLMVVLIPLLLLSATFTKLAIRELNLPPASSKGQGAGVDKPKEPEKRLFLSVIISKQGFYVSTRGGHLSGKSENEEGPSIPLKPDGNYDYEQLQVTLREIKDKILGQGFADEKSVIISAEADIPYKYIIRTIDYVTQYETETGETQELFPQIIIGNVI